MATLTSPISEGCSDVCGQSIDSEPCCNICKSTTGNTGRLVRDHDHKTGVIRGLLCDWCNACVGIIESRYHQERGTLHKGRRRKEWLEKYKDAIVNHMNSDSGVRYKGSGSVKDSSALVTRNLRARTDAVVERS